LRSFRKRRRSMASVNPDQMDFFSLFDGLLGVKATRDGWTKCRRCGGVYLTDPNGPETGPENLYKCPKCGWLPEPPLGGAGGMT
jgi:hypothetical protein